MTILTKVANLLDAMADEADAKPVSSGTPDPLLARLEARVGAPLPDEVRAKLADDDALRRVLAPIIEAPDPPRPLGEPAEKEASATPLTKAERRKAAEDEFAARILRRAQG